MHGGQKRGFHKIWWFLPGLILAVAVETALAVFVCLSGYGAAGGAAGFSVKPDQIYDYSQTEQRFSVTGPAPNMELSVGSEAGYVELVFSEPLTGDSEFYCYYTKEKGQDFNQYRRIERFLMDGSSRARIFLPKDHQGRIRIDIRGDFTLDHIEVGNQIPLSGLRIGAVAGQMNPLRLAAMILILGFSGVLLAGKTKKDSRKATEEKAAEEKETKEKETEEKETDKKVAAGAEVVRAVKPVRTVYLDAARVIAAFFVIVVHVVEPVSILQTPGTVRGTVYNGTVIFVLTCNLMFFFISGALLLPGKDESIGTFYKKRLWKIVLPFLIYSVFYLRGMCASVMGFLPWLTHAAGDLLSGKVIMAPHFWMIYELLGVYLLAPFLRLMVKKLTPRMEQWLFGLIVLSLFIQTGGLYWNQTFGVTMFLASWPGIFLGGYLLSRPWMRRLHGGILFAGVLAFVLSVGLSLKRPDFKDIVCNLSILMFCMTAALFVLLMRMERLLCHFASILSLFSRYSYSVLLVHWFAMSAILSNGILPKDIYSRSSLQMIFSIAAVTVMSFFIAFVMDHTAVPVIGQGIEKLEAAIQSRLARK